MTVGATKPLGGIVHKEKIPLFMFRKRELISSHTFPNSVSILGQVFLYCDPILDQFKTQTVVV